MRRFMPFEMLKQLNDSPITELFNTIKIMFKESKFNKKLNNNSDARTHAHTYTQTYAYLSVSRSS